MLEWAWVRVVERVISWKTPRFVGQMDGSCHQDDELLKGQVMISLQSEDQRRNCFGEQPLCPQLHLEAS